MTWMGTAVRNAFGVAWRHRWTYAVPVATLLLPATLYAVRLPDLYRARAVVFARPLEGARGRSLPTERAAQTYELVQTSRDRLLTNANAAPVVPLLYPGHTPDDPWALQAVKGRIQWDRAGDSAFAVSLEDTSPKVAADAVNAMIRAFQESERARKVADAEGPLRSFEAQHTAAKERSDAASRAVDEYRNQNDGVLPEQESTITQELTQLRGEITWQEQSANSARQRGQFLAEQVSRWGAAAATDTPGRKASADEDKLEGQLKEQQKSFDDVRKRLVEEETLRTDKHPSVQALRRQLQILESDVAKTVSALDGSRRAAQARASKQHLEQTRTAVDDLKAMRAQAEQDERLAGEAAKDLRGRMQTLHARLGRIPGVRPKLLELLRRAEEEAKRVGALDAHVISAQSVVDHLRGDPNNVTGYRVDEWAVAPVLPSGPARWKYLAVAVGLGLVIGYGVRSLRKRYEQPPLAQPQELREPLPGALVVTVPLLAEGLRPKRELVVRELALGLWVCVAIGTSALALAARKGIVTPPEWLRPIVGGPRVTGASAQQSQIVPLSAAPVGLLAERDAQGWKAPAHPDPTTADAYLRLTAHLLLQTERQTCRSVGVTSAHQGEGKTTAAMNLAVCLGRTRGRRGRVLLVDADARQRTLTRLLGGAAPQDASASQRHPMLLSTSFDGVDLMTAPDPQDPLALYAPGVWRATLQELVTRYEHVVIDCPSVLDHPAGMVLRDCVDALVLVVQSGRTPKRDVERALSGASRRVLGVVLNGAEGRALENWA